MPIPSSCLYLSSSGVVGVCHHAWKKLQSCLEYIPSFVWCHPCLCRHSHLSKHAFQQRGWLFVWNDGSSWLAVPSTLPRSTGHRFFHGGHIIMFWGYPPSACHRGTLLVNSSPCSIWVSSFSEQSFHLSIKRQALWRSKHSLWLPGNLSAQGWIILT